jgi:hypothetical protein
MKIRYRRAVLNAHPTLFDWSEEKQCPTQYPWQCSRVAKRCKLSRRHAQLVCELLGFGSEE